jgi:hypothetical protein
MTRLAVSEAVLSWAVERSGVPLAGLQRRFPKLEEWLRGETEPTLRQLEELANATATPLGFLLLDEPPEERLPIPHFRTVREVRPRRPSVNLLETVYVMQRRQQRSPEPVFLRWKGLEASADGDFYVRSGPGSVRLAPDSAREYIRTRFAQAR